jgi:ATP/maltotriose-dependent transcriptional regulator MalT
MIEALSEASQNKLTLLQAGAGYWKSTALASFVEEHKSIILTGWTVHKISVNTQ